MNAQPTKRNRSYDQCTNVGCEITTAEGTHLQACRACGVARYCSRECQKSDWKTHKKQCKKHQDASNRLNNSEDPSLQNAYARVTKWILRHRPALGEALISSFDLPNNPYAHRRQILEVTARYLPDVDDEHCLVLMSVRRGDLSATAQPYFVELVQQRETYEELSVRADPDVYGTGLVLLMVHHGDVQLFARSLPITFTSERGIAEVEEDRVWKAELWKRTDSFR
ncbi:hypothetical protein EIP91_000995 [Steccherinum ochraceum]|uniref:MYND-type domain-containing protein n=1 Tax=Steccherinum ochraceum TaxID=92696 RepID=A0A4R0RVI0_9APHY|nr:hypothetical protein EIP91_000995 [Steccherinum ochraceum]